MPPRIPATTRFGVQTFCLRPAPSSNALPITQMANLVTMAQRRKYKDPYALAQAKSRKEANLSRQKVLQEQRKIALGDPIRGIPTPFVESFDTAGASTTLIDATPVISPSPAMEFNAPEGALLNHYLTPTELKKSIQHSIALTQPTVNVSRVSADPVLEAEAKKKFEEGHERATIALARIVSLANSSQKDKTRANVVRCIETFGRHKTDATLRPRLSVNPSMLGGKPLLEKTPRAGPDTGSSEVQVAILTAKIRVLANQLETKGGKKDKINKRNLRIMVHKRQKHLTYLRRKERGGDRWQHLISTLGLTEGTWKGEISI